MFFIENIQYLSLLFLLASLLVYFISGINLIFSCIMLLNPYVSALLCFLKIFIGYLVEDRGRLNKKGLLTFLIVVSISIVPYFDSVFNLRTFAQFIQFLILVFVLTVLILPEKAVIKKPISLLKNLRFSCLILAIVKIYASIVGVQDFFLFGKNEDAMLLVLIGAVSSLYLYFRKNSFWVVFDFLILVFAINLYESRSALFFIFLIPFFVFFCLLYSDKDRGLNKIYILLFILFSLASLLLSLDFIFSKFGLDQANNYSNLERLGMYFFTYDYMFSGNYFGVGIGNLDIAMEEMYSEKYILAIYPHPHSSILRFSLELGVVGFLLYFLFVLYLFKLSLSLLKYERYIGTVIFVFTLSILYFSLFDSIFYSFFRGILTALMLCTLISLKKITLNIGG